jgi:hypothetical protein
VPDRGHARVRRRRRADWRRAAPPTARARAPRPRVNAVFLALVPAVANPRAACRSARQRSTTSCSIAMPRRLYERRTQQQHTPVPSPVSISANRGGLGRGPTLRDRDSGVRRSVLSEMRAFARARR